MKYFLNILLILFIGTELISQTKIQIKLDGGQGFFSVYPPPEDPKGILILIPDYLQDEESFLRNNKIMNQAYYQGIVTVIVNVGRKIFASGSVVELLSEVCTKTTEGFEVDPSKVVFGGYGYGGTILLKYAQLCLKYKNDFPLTPAAIYAVNSHVDITLAFKTYERQIERNVNLELTQSAKNFKDILLRTLEGTPEEDPFIYESFSPFIYGTNSVDNIEMLIDTPIRLYHDTDLVWNMKNEQKSALDMQATASSELIYQLNKLGNSKAELISTNVVTTNSSKRTHVDEKELNTWIKKQLEIK